MHSEREMRMERKPVMNSFSISTASVIIRETVSGCGLRRRCRKSRQAKSVCIPSSLLISSLENVSPGIRPRFFSQNIAAKQPEKNMPSTAAKATKRSAKVERMSEIHRRAHSALCLTHGMLSMALKRCARSCESRIYVSMSREYVSE